MTKWPWYLDALTSFLAVAIPVGIIGGMTIGGLWLLGLIGNRK